MDVRTLNSYDIDFLYTTTTLGVDPGYSNQSFYSGIMGKDTARHGCQMAIARFLAFTCLALWA